MYNKFMDTNKLLKNIGFGLGTIIFLLGIAYGIGQSDFTKIKKYDENKAAIRSDMSISKSKQKFAKSRRYSNEVEVFSNGMVSLGDFIINIADSRKLVANISVKYSNDEKWYDLSHESDEMQEKSIVLRNAVINALYGVTAETNSDKIKDKIKHNLNGYLSTGKVEEVYFNKFIIQ